MLSTCFETEKPHPAQSAPETCSQAAQAPHACCEHTGELSALSETSTSENWTLSLNHVLT
jgi:hypothetical protein